jgi:hypothetical protein
MDATPEELMHHLEAEHAEMIRAIVAANHDLAARSHSLGVRAEYDPDEDAISVTIGPTVETSTESVDNRFYFSVEPETLKIVGIDIFGVRDLVTNPPEALEGMAEAAVALAAAILVQANIAEGRVVDTLADGIRELVAASSSSRS